MLTSGPAILHSTNASLLVLRETRGLQPLPDRHRLLPPFSSPTSSLSTQSSSSRRKASSTPTDHEAHDEGEQETQRQSETFRTDVPTCSLDTSQAAKKQPVCQPLLQGTQRGLADVGSEGATHPVDTTALISSTINQSKTDRDMPIYLPRRYELCPVGDMVELISHMLGQLIATNDLDPITSGGLTRFHSKTAPGISVRDYLNRLAVHATLAPALLLAMVYYVDRLCVLYQGFSINTLTVHRFLIAAATVAAKGLSDAFCRNYTYARIGGVAVRELKILELELLYRLDWRIVPDPEDLMAYYQRLVERMVEYELEPTATEENNRIS